MSKKEPVGIVDVGSNSVRLVVFDQCNPSAAEVHNEKMFCELGRDLPHTGMLHVQGKAQALRAMKRFKYLCDSLNVSTRLPFATAAVRDATDGAEFLTQASATFGTDIRLLSGESEAKLAARGALMHVDIHAGLICDMGGGSLEIASVNEHGAITDAISLPLGGLIIGADMALSRKQAKQHIREQLSKAQSLLASGADKPLYLVGGGLRALARLHMAYAHYPLKLLHHYHVKAKDFKHYCKQLSLMPAEDLDKVPEISRRRQQVVPAAALLMKELIKASGASSITVSTSGVREGVFWEHIPIAQRIRPDLSDELQCLSQSPTHAQHYSKALMQWLTPLKAEVSDTHWQQLTLASLMAHTDAHNVMVFRADMAFLHMLYASLPRLTHQMRAMLAMIIFHRHRYTPDYPLPNWPIDGITDTDIASARFMGTALQLACHLSPGDAQGLNHIRLELKGQSWHLHANGDSSSNATGASCGDASRKRLERLNRAYSYYLQSATAADST